MFALILIFRVLLNNEAGPESDGTLLLLQWRKAVLLRCHYAVSLTKTFSKSPGLNEHSLHKIAALYQSDCLSLETGKIVGREGLQNFRHGVLIYFVSL